MSSRGRRRKRGGSGNSSDGGNSSNQSNSGNSNSGNSNGGNANGKSGKGNRNDSAKSPKSGRSRNSGGGGSSKGKAGRQKPKQKTQKFDAPDFWGDNELLPEERGYQVDLEDTTAILRSLGRPPIPGSEAAAEHHFAMVYERSVNLAKALAAAGGLDQELEAPAAEKPATAGTSDEAPGLEETAT